MSIMLTYKKEFLKVLLYYSIGSAVSYLAYLLIPHTYVHAPGVHHFLVFLMFIISFIWGVANFLFSFSEKGTDSDRFTGIFHLIPCAAFVVWLVYTISSY
jgi:hypothetical protein